MGISNQFWPVFRFELGIPAQNIYVEGNSFLQQEMYFKRKIYFKSEIFLFLFFYLLLIVKGAGLARFMR